MKHSSGITPDQLRELHKTILKASLQTETLMKGLDQESEVYSKLLWLQSDIEAIIFNKLYPLLEYCQYNYEPIDVDTEINLK
jgi:hypothetical protein